MTDAKRDIIDLSATADAEASAPTENQPVKAVERPMASPQANAAFLSDFLADKKAETAAHNGTAEETAEDSAAEGLGDTSPDAVQGRVIEALKEIYDPEIPVNIYELGLIYEVNISDSGLAEVVMTLTTPNCPVAESMPGEVELRVNSVPGVMGAEVKLVWEPAWDMSRMTDEARLELGLL